MACGFRNSAGTDLDDLFYVDNSNGGALGFRISNGIDLGNRFTNKSTLGYNVGYKNNAGTDIGYLRGKMVAPTNPSVSLTRPRYDLNGGSGAKGARIYFNIYINAGVPIETVTIGYRITYTYIRFDGTSYYKFFDNHNITPISTGSADGQFYDHYAGTFRTITYNGINSHIFSHNFGIACIPRGWYHARWNLVCDCAMYNAAGSASRTSNEYVVNFDQMT